MAPTAPKRFAQSRGPRKSAPSINTPLKDSSDDYDEESEESDYSPIASSKKTPRTKSAKKTTTSTNKSNALPIGSRLKNKMSPGAALIVEEARLVFENKEEIATVNFMVQILDTLARHFQEDGVKKGMTQQEIDYGILTGLQRYLDEMDKRNPAVEEDVKKLEEKAAKKLAAERAAKVKEWVMTQGEVTGKQGDEKIGDAGDER